MINTRRLRLNPMLRNLVRDIRLSPHDFVYPLFIKHGLKDKQEIKSMPGQYQWPVNQLKAEIKLIQSLNIPAVILFGIPEKKDAIGSDACDSNGIIAQAIREIKSIAPDLLVIADTCFCEYTDHGHCGILDDGLKINANRTLDLLAQQAVIQAESGADIIAPSGMMDLTVKTIRAALDQNNYHHIPILNYSVKYASSFYGPFREAAEGAPQFGDRSSYQMDFANQNEAIKEVKLDIAEGVDMIMVKPALSYLDIISKINQNFPEIPLGAYQVSGEYSMIKAAAQNNWIDEEKVVLESLTAIKRAGANFIVTYFAKQAAKLLQN